MRAAERSMVVFGAYLAVLGVTLALVPDVLLVPLGFPAPTEVWIRVVGLLALGYAYYFVMASRASAAWFMRASIAVRCFVAVALIAFALASLAGPLIALFAVPDLAGAAWTAYALRGAPRL